MNILFDIGGTKTRVASVKNEDSFNEPVIFDTPQSFEEGFEKLSNTISEISKGEKVESIVGGIAGALNRKTKVLVKSPNLPQWVGKDLVGGLEKSFSCPVYVENDSARAGLGEALYGAGKGHNIVAYVTVSTGVGGARIVNGAIDVSSFGFEPGHQIIDADLSIFPQAEGIDLESLISGKSVEKRVGKKPSEIADDSFWDEEAKLLAYGLNNTIVHWSPDVIVLGGSMINEVGISVDKVVSHLKNILPSSQTYQRLRRRN